MHVRAAVAMPAPARAEPARPPAAVPDVLFRQYAGWLAGRANSTHSVAALKRAAAAPGR